MSLLKKQSVGVWANIVCLIAAIVTLILYTSNVAGEGYFQHASVPNAELFMWLNVALLVVVIALAQLSVKGVAATVVNVVSDACRILVPVLSIAGVMNLVSSRVQGFAFIFFSNPEVLQEVQTPANMSSANGAIASIVALAVTAVLAMIAAFFGMKKKVK